MTDRLATAVSRCLSRAQGQAAATVTYSRGALSVSLTAVIGQKLLKVTDGAGAERIDHADRDWLIDAARLILGSVAVKPARGDRITTAAGEVYEALPVGDEPVYQNRDGRGLMYRVHTKKVT